MLCVCYYVSLCLCGCSWLCSVFMCDGSKPVYGTLSVAGRVSLVAVCTLQCFCVRTFIELVAFATSHAFCSFVA